MALDGAGHARGRAAMKKRAEAISKGIPHGTSFTDVRSQYGAASSAAGSCNFEDDDEDDDGQNEVAIVREPTDLSMPEEDIIVEGGVGENEIMNGLYFKLTATFGIPTYRLMKKTKTSFWSRAEVHERFLYKDTMTNCWVISPKTNGGVSISVGCGFSDDTDAQRPTEVRNAWYVWHVPSNTLKSPEEEKIKLKGDEEGLKFLVANPIDVIKIRSVVGFEISQVPAGVPGPLSGLVLRHASEYYGRPVYESESGGQFVYWMASKGKKEDGHDEKWTRVDWPNSSANFYSLRGYWAISKEVGADTESPDFYAYVEDDSATPAQIPDDKRWLVKKAGSWIDSNMKLTCAEWDRKRDLVDTFEVEDAAATGGGAAAGSSGRPSAEPDATTPLLAAGS